MRLTVIGCGDAFGSGGRGNSCFHLAADRLSVALDFGASALVDAKRRGVDPAGLDAVILSHLHGDHFGGLPFLLLDGQYGARRIKPLTIVGPPGTAARLADLCEAMFPGMTGTTWRYAHEVREVAPGSAVTLGGLVVGSAEVVHKSGAPSTALRIAGEGRIIAFSGDTEWTEALLPIAAGADLFICECYRFDGAPTGHMAYETLAARDAELGAKRILLTHMSAAMWARRAEVDGARFQVAEDGLTIDV
ncbi:MBL fold metallo-hydrolase [Aquabacter spiritensis]|uniref:Ribonuclease BN (tRNA processing enzyme) n=1 Tax=Aquabacter spiritensis TaxID=933073 RepID=A0A4V2UX72_9HYPH|nr:MBL fold metallo-hydrolase [Aquabacter spiritensis]TCT02418.1 ribonuclease BN (tRNA processing enzyme) [Aquabacter spiritensis]